MLTKGDKKLSRTDMHFRNVADGVSKGVKEVTMTSSDDATTWAQRFIMPVFGCLLSRILPKEFVEPCLFVLNLVTTKKLELPSQLLNLFDDNIEIEGFDDGLNELKKQYLGLSSQYDLVNPRCRMLKNRSNMMQGILHYTSSLLHSGYLLLWEDYSKLILKSSVRTRTAEELNITCSSKVSSDDSSAIITVMFPNYVKPFFVRSILTCLSKLKAKLYKFLIYLNKLEWNEQKRASHSLET
jgi:hypothetical protein